MSVRRTRLATPEARSLRRTERSLALFTPTLLALAGLFVLVLSVAIDEPVSLGSLLGVLLLLSAAIRYLMARNGAKA